MPQNPLKIVNSAGMADIRSKGDLEARLYEEKQDIKKGNLKEDAPLDLSENFHTLCLACRSGDLKACQEMIMAGTRINAVDRFDYTPLILASLCGHYEVVRLLLESGALCERDTFQGERALYNALTDKIRSLLLEYDYSKSANPLQPLAGHIMSLLSREEPRTTDLTLNVGLESFELHKFVLAIRSPFFARKLGKHPQNSALRIPLSIPPESVRIVVRFIYLAELPSDIVVPAFSSFTERDILLGVEKLSRLIELPTIWERLLEPGDRRQARQRQADDIALARDEIDAWLQNKIFARKIEVDSDRAADIQFNAVNDIFADILLQAEHPESHDQREDPEDDRQSQELGGEPQGLPIGPFASSHRQHSPARPIRKSTLYPVHRVMLLRSEYFNTMFSSSFLEAKPPIPESTLQIVKVDCAPDTLEVILAYLYTERADIPLELSMELLFTADLMMIDALKTKAAVAISTLGSKGSFDQPSHPAEAAQDAINIFDVIRAGWMTRTPRLEDFGARYMADRLENYIEMGEFEEIIRESATRMTAARQETDTIELLDDIRFYLGERFRLRFEDAGLEEMMDEEAVVEAPEVLSPFMRFPMGDDDEMEDGEMGEEGEAEDVRGAAGLEDQRNDEARDKEQSASTAANMAGVTTMDGELAGDEFAADAFNYRMLLGKIDALLERLRMGA